MRHKARSQSRRPALRRLQQIVLTGLAMALAACSASPPAPLEDVCQFRACVCADMKAAFWQLGDTKPLLWAENGAPYCPPGYALRRTGEP